MHAGIHNNNNKYYRKRHRQKWKKEKRKNWREKKLRILWISTEICLPCVRRVRQNTRNTGLCVNVEIYIYRRFSGIVFTQRTFRTFFETEQMQWTKMISMSFRWGERPSPLPKFNYSLCTNAISICSKWNDAAASTKRCRNDKFFVSLTLVRILSTPHSHHMNGTHGAKIIVYYALWQTGKRIRTHIESSG